MKRIIFLLLSLNLIFINVFADNLFKDIQGNHWALPYIKKMSDLKIIVGYSDGTFGANEKVNKYVATLVIYRALDSQGLIENSKKELYVSRYKHIIDKYNVPNWTQLHEAIGFFLENNIITEKDLSEFVKNGKNVNITREEMALFLGKSLNLYFKEDVNKIITPIFKDHMSIDYDCLKYLNILNKKNIISGDNLGNFNPKNNLTRAELSKLLSISLDELSKSVKVNEEIVRAVVKVKLDDTNSVIFYKENSNVISYKEKIDNSIEIILNNKKANYIDLRLDMLVNLYYSNGKLYKITANSNDVISRTKSGYVTEILDNSNGKFMYLKEGNNKTTFLNIDKDVKVYNNGKVSNFININVGDYVNLEIMDDVVKVINYKEKSNKISGTLLNINLKNNVLVLDVNGNSIEFSIDNDVFVERNNQKVNLSDLQINDNLILETKFDVVVDIRAIGHELENVGYITKIILSKTPQLAIKDINGIEKIYDIDDKTLILIDNVFSKYSDLRIDYKVKIKSEQNYLKEVSATIVLDKKVVVGRIVNKLDDISTFIISSDENINYTVNTKSSTYYLNKNNEKGVFKHFEVGDKVFVYGQMEDRIMNAEKVISLD